MRSRFGFVACWAPTAAAARAMRTPESVRERINGNSRVRATPIYPRRGRERQHERRLFTDLIIVSTIGSTAAPVAFRRNSPYDMYDSHTYDMLAPELKKGSAEFLLLSLIEHEPRHGYELSKLIESRSKGAITFHVASLYPLLYRMEDRGWIVGRWVEKAGERRRRFYSITDEGRDVLIAQRESWKEFVKAISLVAGVRNA